MQAEYYSDKSIAVFGDTKPWAGNLRALGGKFNANLKGRHGWIFQRNKETELMQFIAQAQQGLIQPLPQTNQQTNQQTQTQTPYPIATPQMVPFGQTQPAMTPQAAMARLTVAQPTIPFPQVQPITSQQAPVIPTPQVGPVTAIKPLSPKPATVLPAQPLQVGFPNMFTAADGLTYQIIIYTTPVPSMGQRVTLTVGDTNLEYTVTGIQKNTAPFDDILLTQVLPQDVEQGTEAPVSRAIIMNGQWKIYCMQDEHSLQFHPLTQ